MAFSCLLLLYEDHNIGEIVNKVVSWIDCCRQVNMILNFNLWGFLLHELYFEFLIFFQKTNLTKTSKFCQQYLIPFQSPQNMNFSEFCQAPGFMTASVQLQAW